MAMSTEHVDHVYGVLRRRVDIARQVFGRGLTLAEKILVGHLPEMDQLATAKSIELKRKSSTVGLRPDRVAMQDATAQMALLQFMHAGMEKVAVPSTVHCDHLIRAYKGAASDLAVANHENDEVFNFLKTVSARYGVGFWEPGSGIIHQVVLENYAFPGGMMIGTDSHTPNAGGLGMIAIGIGGADAVDVMAGQTFGLKWPGVIGVRLSGKLSGWAAPKDIILCLMGILTVKGGTGHIVEFFGEGASSISCTGKATVCNMGAEHGATTSVFPFDESMARYLEATDRADIAALARKNAEFLRADDDVLAHPEKFYDRIIDIDLSALDPWIVGPHSPDVARPQSTMKDVCEAEKFPTKLKYALIGSCTNSSYEDISRAAHLARQALAAGLTLKTPLMVSPGSNQVAETIDRDGQLRDLRAIGATVLANACGPCIGQWQRDDVQKGERNAIVSSFNRNFPGRNDDNPETLSFIGSPELVIALAFAGNLDFDPQKDTLTKPDGSLFKFEIPQGQELPKGGFAGGDLKGYNPPPADGSGVVVRVAADSHRLQLLERFKPWDGRDFEGLVVLMKARGKCTTDHISKAGPWLRFRGHLQNISDNMFLGAANAFTGEVGKGRNVLDNTMASYPEIAKYYKSHGQGWVAIGDENYGEGSSREHAAMSPRFLGAKAVIVRSFARIHETNLKKQGLLPLTFVDPADYDRVQEDDRVAIHGLANLAPGKEIEMILHHADATSDKVLLKHTMTEEQIGWFKAGSALNRIAEEQQLAGA